MSAFGSPGSPGSPRSREAGFFGPGSAAWSVNREAILLAGGPRALLLQLAHPLVAAGVAEHSDFTADPLGRLRRTLTLTLALVFGTRQEALRSARAVRVAHERVRGVLTDATRRYPEGTPYRALDPALQLWVHATLVDSSLVTYHELVGPLSAALRRAAYQDSRRVADLLGIPAALVPPDLRSFRRYFRAMISGDELEVTPTAQRIARAVLHPSRPLWLRSASPLGVLLASALLPPRLRWEYGLPWGRLERSAWVAARAGARSALRWLPDSLRLWPEARAARARLGPERG